LSGIRPFWTWTCFHPNGRVETKSAKFLSYGDVMQNAICKGEFKSRSESWGVTNATGTWSYFNIEPPMQNGSQVIHATSLTGQSQLAPSTPPKGKAP
jgi:hypothetical protein